jgi:osmotically inducible protein OsmC
MAVQRVARAVWKGTLLEGRGELTAESSQVMVGVPVTWPARTEEPAGRTSPEELLAAAHATCYSMSLSNVLAKQDTPADTLDVRATCSADKTDAGFRVQSMDLEVIGIVPGLNQSGFEKAAREAEEACPISITLRGNIEIRVRAELQSGPGAG